MGINCHSFLTGVMTFFSLTFFAHFRKKGKRIEFFSMGMNCHSFLTGGIIVFFLFCSGRAKPQRTTYGLIATTYSAQTEVQENGSFFVHLDMYLENKTYRFFIRFIIFTYVNVTSTVTRWIHTQFVKSIKGTLCKDRHTCTRKQTHKRTHRP